MKVPCLDCGKAHDPCEDCANGENKFIDPQTCSTCGFYDNETKICYAYGINSWKCRDFDYNNWKSKEESNE